MKEYKNKFLYYINNLKFVFSDDFFNDENFEEMSIEGGCNEDENMLEQINRLDDGEEFLDENIMILDE